MQKSFRRYDKNPILTAADLPGEVGYYILNPGAVKFQDEYLLLTGVFHREGSIIFWLARSRDGYDFRFDPAPVSMPVPWVAEAEVLLEVHLTLVEAKQD